MNALVHKARIRTVTVSGTATVKVKLQRPVSDAEVREFFEMDESDEVTLDMIEEFLLEKAEDDAWDVASFEDWGMKWSTEVVSEETRMVAPPAFVPLPGMEDLEPV